MIPTTMRSPHFAGQGHIDFIDKPVLQPGPGELLVQVHANALCGSERGQHSRMLPANLAQFHQHHDTLRQIITHRFGVEDIQAAFELFWRGETGKIVIEQ